MSVSCCVFVCSHYNATVMHPLIEQHLPQIEALCRKHRVKRLEVFGSVTTDRFDPKRSDLDFFYEFPEEDKEDLADRFFGLIEDLQLLFGRKIDLVSAKDATNPYFLQVANPQRQTLYAA
jgi:predicted nucleotidyltransferase